MHLAVVGADGVSEIVDEHAQALHLLWVRIVVGTVHKRNILPEIILRDSLIGHQHKVLNDFCGRIALIGLDVHRVPLLIQNNLGLREIKVDGAALTPLLPQNVRQFFHEIKHLHKISVLFHGLLVTVRHNGIHCRVGHAAVYPDHGLSNLMAQHTTLGINLHDAAKCQTVRARIQGADAVGELVGQHRDDPVYQIHAGAAV